MANRTAIHGQHRNLQAVTPTCQWIRIDVANVNALREWRELTHQRGDEIVA